jgi:hypothetical protein
VSIRHLASRDALVSRPLEFLSEKAKREFVFAFSLFYRGALVGARRWNRSGAETDEEKKGRRPRSAKPLFRTNGGGPPRSASSVFFSSAERGKMRKGGISNSKGNKATALVERARRGRYLMRQGREVGREGGALENIKKRKKERLSSRSPADRNKTKNN